ncbi:MAG: NAD-dependent DNA ligase LigA, partial [Halieaceae bacterium]|nr:NAD-dependent DNA ligase LigA [Halieaceae bacterium]
MTPPLPTEARERARALRSRLEQWNREYYAHDAPSVPDAEYDRALRELEALEAEYPQLVDESSPTQRVGSPP